VKEGSHRKYNWNLILTAISTVTAILSMFAAFMANKQAHQSLQLAIQANEIAEEANRIAQEALLPKISIEYLFSFQDYEDYYKEPCRTDIGTAKWTVSYAPIIDITNTGGLPISLVEIEPYYKDVETLHPLIQASVSYAFFGTPSAFDEWYNQRLAPLSFRLNQFKEKVDVSGPPISIEPGETHRIILLGRVDVRIDEQLTPNDVLRITKNANWDLDVTFIFGDGSNVKISIPTPRPYEWWPVDSISDSAFDLCPSS